MLQMSETSRPFSVACSRAGLLVVSLVAASCAAPPPPPVIVSYEEKLAAILRLEDHRVLRDPAPAPVAVTPSGSGVIPPPPPPPNLVAMLGDADARIRRRAALAIGRVGLTEGVNPLAALLADPVVDVRQMAAFALGLLKDPGPSAALRAALSDASPAVQGRAAEALGFIGDQASAAPIGEMVARHVREVQALAPDHEAPLEAGPDAFRLGLGALVRLKAYDALAAAVLDPAGQPLAHWWPVAFALERIAEPRAAPALLLLARTEGRYTRGFAVKGLGSLKEQRAVPVLVPMLALADREPGLAAEAARALGKIADPLARADLTRLSVNFKVSPMIRAEAVTALGAIRTDDTLPALLNVVGDRSPTVRAAALSALSRHDPEALVTVLSSLDFDPHWSVRSALAAAIVAVDRTIAVPRLQEMLADQDQRVIPAVLSALARVKAPNVEGVLIERLAAEDPIVRATAATELGELLSPAAVPALIAAYRFGVIDNTYTARAAALAALAKHKDDAAWDAIAGALRDKDWALRLRASELLRGRDATVDVSAMRPAPVSLSAADYRSADLVAPRYSPHAYVDTDKGTIEIELAVLDAPLTARNFVALARRGWFNNLAIHRVVPNFVVQDGDPRGDGEGSPGYTIRDELNGRPYLRGTVGMALDWADTGGSQFFITHSPQPHLDARYTVFGHVVSGMEVVDRLDQWDVIRRIRVWDGVQFAGGGEAEAGRGR
jgi:HEAT repeat protein/cyclophilin family peptidyl-prolyl cis-trans isomerase